jgi:hypothetical protein
MISEITKGKTKMAKKANSNLLKEAIADARAVRETALKNAEIAIQEALTPRLQSIISRKIQAEMEEEDDDVEVIDGDDVDVADFDDEMEIEEDESFEDEVEIDDEDDVVDMDVTETFEDPEDDVTGSSYDVTEDDDVEFDADDMDLEEIIRELEGELENDDDVDFDVEDTDDSDDEELDIELEEDDDIDFEDSDDDGDFESDDDSDDIDLDEILREMGYGDDEEEVTEEEDEVEVSNTDELESELEEAYRTIRVLKTTINEVNLLNAKLLYANKVFRQYNLTTEQKRKIVESFDRTGTVREVKLVFATISESMKLTGTAKIKKITEGFASKTTKSTAPKGIINEDVDFGMTEFQKRNKELAGIIRK